MASSRIGINQQLEQGRKKHQRRNESPAGPSKPRRTREKGQTITATDECYSVRNIIDETGQKYLIDWEDDPVTGKSFSPTWVR